MLLKILITTGAMVGISGLLALLLLIAEHFLANYGECTLSINNEKQVHVQGGTSLLAALNSQKIFLPSACGGRGTCAYCKCKILAGAGPLLPTEEPLLTPDEIRDSFRLSCQVKVKQDMQIAIPEELFNIREFKTEVSLIKDLTYDIKLLRLNLIEPEEITFKAGQYIQLITKPYNGVKESVSRAYSIASPSYEKKYIDLMIRLVPEGICTTWVHQHLREKEIVNIVGPMGDFYLREGAGEIIMVAGASGMAPIISLLEEIAARKIERNVTYFFGAVAKRDLFFTEEIAALKKRLPNFQYIPTLSQSQPGDAWEGETGLITQPLERYIKNHDTSQSQVYMCGSPGMINACIAVLNKNSIQNERIYYDPFA
ncbi:2Fe-2S iron-sulfur cluster binding domain-containing protein [candidate division KSB1 bacterium]|nr:2Fe-2S iron-sulfur cluster binding domain-containing protein [candidate division KSB1 bacterium]